MVATIVIPTHNRKDLLLQTLGSVSGEMSGWRNVECVVVANACTDGSAEAAADVIGRLGMHGRVVTEPTAGLNVARNRGVAESQGDIIIFLDDDVLLEPGWLSGHLETYGTAEADLVAGKLLLWWEAVARPPWLKERLENLLSAKDHGDTMRKLESGSQAVGANFSFRRKVFDSINGFRLGLDRTGTLLLSGGDTDFVDRAITAGFNLFYAPKAAARHWVPPHRATKQHLYEIAYGRGQSQVYMKATFGMPQVLRQLAGRTYLMSKGVVTEVCARLAASESDAVVARTVFMSGLGGLNATLNRALGRSPVR